MKNNVEMINEVTTGETLEKGGYFVAYNLVIRNVMKVYDLSPGEFSCLTMLFSYAGSDKNKCFPGQERLASDLNTSKRTVIRYLEGLETKGAIITYNRFNKKNMKTKNVYDLSPCLDKIRELYAPKENEEFILVRKEKHNLGGDKIVTTEELTPSENEPEKVAPKVDSVEVTDLSLPRNETRQKCHPTSNNNNKQLKPLNNIKIDDDIANSVSPSLEEADINLVIETLREGTKKEITKRSFDSVLRKVMDKHKQGKVINFRDYLISSLNAKIEELELRRIKDQAKQELASTSPSESSEEYSGNIAFYNFLDEEESKKAQQPLKIS